jgi:hypothetical protein
MAGRGEADWAAVETEYRAGKLGNRQIAKKFGVPESTLRHRAKVGGWVRNAAQPALEHQRPKREALPAVQTIIPPRPVSSDPVETASSVSLGKDLAHRLLGELDMATSRQDEIEDAIYEETKDDENGRRRQLMLKAVSLPARAMTLKTLAQALGALKDVEEGAAQGKKAQRQQSANQSASGRFAPPAPPKLVVNNPK